VPEVQQVGHRDRKDRQDQLDQLDRQDHPAVHHLFFRIQDLITQLTDLLEPFQH
jgi:hypothetical protein